MSQSKSGGPAGSNPVAAAPRTGGPLGSNGDAADPATPAWFRGDTPGPLGHADHADPNGRMCRARSAADGSSLARALADYRAGKVALRQKVRDELRENYRIRDAFADPKLLAEAKAKDWSAQEYQAAVNEKLFGKPRPGQSTAVVPMYTDPMSCRITENWNRERYRAEGLPEIVFLADRVHEEAHQSSCKARPNMQYNADMSFPARLAEDERKAYTAKIDMLERWLRDDSQ